MTTVMNKSKVNTKYHNTLIELCNYAQTNKNIDKIVAFGQSLNKEPVEEPDSDLDVAIYTIDSFDKSEDNLIRLAAKIEYEVHGNIWAVMIESPNFTDESTIKHLVEEEGVIIYDRRNSKES